MIKSFVLTDALALAHAGSMLALDENAIGRPCALLDADSPIGEVTPAAGRVAVMHIRGLLLQRTTLHADGVCLGYDLIADGFARLMADPAVSAVVLCIDSGGGSVAGLFSCIAKMVAARDAARKPVFAYADEVACSAAYALACVASHGIYLPSTGEVGSIGALRIHCDESAAQEGRVFSIVRSGRRKAETNALEPLSETARAALQVNVDEIATEFFELVASTRGVPPEQLRAFEAASFQGRKAVSVGLATGVAMLDQVITMAETAVSGVAMTDEEKADVAALRAELNEMKAKLAALEEEETEEEAPAEEAAPEEAPAPAEEEEEDTSAKAEIARLRAELASRDISAAVDAASRAGKIEPAKRAAMVALGQQIGLDGLKVVLDALPAHAVSRRGGSTPAASNSAALTAVELTVAKQLGLTPEVFASTRDRIAAARKDS